MSTNKKTGRLAGLCYFILVITGIFSLMYVPSQIYVSGDAANTASNIQSSETLFRLGMAVEMVSYVAFLLLPLILYKIFHQVNKTASVLMVAFAVVSIPITFTGILNEFSVLELVRDSAFPNGELESEVMFYMKRYFKGHLIAQIFWALWLFPLGYMIYRSGLIPRVLGIFLMLGSVGYLIDFFGRVISPEYREMTLASYITIPASIGEIGTCLWLLIMGAKETETG
ncbi:MAG: DUF4386 domain-containing protein [Flavobacteriaceae bacterium]